MNDGGYGMKGHLVVLLLFTLLLASCSTHERVMVPPVVTVEGDTVAVLFFDNLTNEYDLAEEVEQSLVRALEGYYKILEPAETEWALTKVGLRRGVMPTSEQAIKLGKLLAVDALVFGEISGYFAPVTLMPPAIVETRDGKDGKEYRWEMAQNTRVMVGFTGQVIDGYSGNVIHHLRVEEESSTEREISLFQEWQPEGKQPDSFFAPKPNKLDIPGQRKSAVKDAVTKFTANLLPTYVWRKIAK